jgi:hypothetical protein
MVKPMLAPSAAPANALRVWSDTTRIYVELPGPHIIPYTKTDAGLSKALSLITTQRYDFSGAPQLKTALKSREESFVEKRLRELKVIP